MATTIDNDHIDPVTFSVVNNAFVNVCREMGTAMIGMDAAQTPRAVIDIANENIANAIRVFAIEL